LIKHPAQYDGKVVTTTVQEACSFEGCIYFDPSCGKSKSDDDNMIAVPADAGGDFGPGNPMYDKAKKILKKNKTAKIQYTVVALFSDGKARVFGHQNCCRFKLEVQHIIDVREVVPGLNTTGQEHKATQATSEAQEVWLLENYEEVRDAVLQKGCPALDEKSSAFPQWEVCIRILPPFESESEVEIYVRRFYDGNVSAVILLPKGQSLFSQLRKLHREHPEYSRDKLIILISTERHTATEKESSALRDLATQFEDLRFSPVPGNDLFSDPTKYEVNPTSNYGMEIDLTLYGPGSAAPKQKDPLIHWVESVKKLLLEAGTKMGGPSRQ
jgi:hypothetical protein